MIFPKVSRDSGASWDARDDTDSERDLWSAMLRRAVLDATAPAVSRTAQDGTVLTVLEQTDARAFLTDRERLAPICEMLGIDTDWFQGQLRLQHPEIFQRPRPQEHWEASPLSWEITWITF